MFGARNQFLGPGGDSLTDVLLLLLLDQPKTDVLDVQLVVVELQWLPLDVGLDVGQQLVDPHPERLELQLVAVPKAEIERGRGTGRGNRRTLELAPAADDLVELLAAKHVVAGPEPFDSLAPGRSCSRILLPILEDTGQQVGR